MTEVLEILKYTVPSIIVLLTTVFILKHHSGLEQKKETSKLFLQNNKQIVPLKMQAYERIVLLLERISPENLSLRLYTQGMNCAQLQSLMLKSIRKEYEHNLSQQVYVNTMTWEAVKNAKESLIQIINVAGTKVKPQMKSIYLNQEIIKIYSKAEITPVQTAINIVKNEIQKQFG